jgi:mRNA-degrading endonuclease toxin of MazEF toxin-antitoxin module
VTNNTYNERVPIIKVVPITAGSEKKAKIRSNVEIEPSEAKGLTKKISCRLFAKAPYRLFFSLDGYPR